MDIASIRSAVFISADATDSQAGNGAPASSDISVRTWWTIITYIAAAAMFLRFYDLPLKPLHHDEGVNTLFLTRLVQPPHQYEYDPGNYHGPTLYYLGWLNVAVFGLTTVAIRMVTAAAGLIAVLLLPLLRPRIGAAGALAAAALLALSPGAVYYSRYFIHEMLLVCFIVAMVIAFALWSESGRSIYVYLAAVAAGLAVATKETVIISAVVLMGAAVGVEALFELRGPRQSAGARAFLPALRRPPGIRLLLSATVTFLGVAVVFYTSLFTHWGGAIDALRSFAIWTKTGTSTQTHPWYTYLEWLAVEELPVLVLGGAGAIWALWKPANRFAAFAALWALGTLAAYSVIPYKTPWLALNIVAPLAITGGYAFDALWRIRRRLPNLAIPLLAVSAIAAASYQTVVLNFVQYDNNRYPYVYVHTSREVFALVREIGRLERLNPGLSIAVTSRDHFPLSWYLRGYRAGYYGKPVATNDPLVVASTHQQTMLDGLLGARYARTGSYTLRPGVQLVLYVRRDLRGT